MRIHPASPALRSQLEDALVNTRNGNPTFLSLLTNFFQGSGIPIPELFEDAQQHFNPIVDIRNVNDEGFQAHMFCWATTGSCEIASDASRISVHNSLFLTNCQCSSLIQVCFVDDDDALYSSDLDTRRTMIAHGKSSFKTCFCEALIPASYVIRLAQHARAHIDGSVFRCAVDHWLLCETLNAIGNHTVM